MFLLLPLLLLIAAFQISLHTAVTASRGTCDVYLTIIPRAGRPNGLLTQGPRGREE